MEQHEVLQEESREEELEGSLQMMQELNLTVEKPRKRFRVSSTKFNFGQSSVSHLESADVGSTDRISNVSQYSESNHSTLHTLHLSMGSISYCDSMVRQPLHVRHNKYQVNFDELPVIPESPTGEKNFARCDIHIETTVKKPLKTNRTQKYPESSGQKINLSRSHCFIKVLEQYFLLFEDVTKIDLLKLQLLNKRCYDYFVPNLMTTLRLFLELPACRLGFFENDIQSQLTEAKSSFVVEIELSHWRTMKNQQDAEQKVKMFMNMHEHFKKHYTWTGKYRPMKDNKYVKSTAFEFESRNRVSYRQNHKLMNKLSEITSESEHVKIIK